MFRKNKYRNSKVSDQEGNKFDSRKEYCRYLELAAAQDEGLITNLEMQKHFTLLPKQKLNQPRFTASGRSITFEQPVVYIADFSYLDKSGNIVVEDTKGVRTKDYIIKRKLMKYIHGIEIVEI